FVVWRLATALFVLLASEIDPSRGRRPLYGWRAYPDTPFLDAFFRWDSLFYAEIATTRYDLVVRPAQNVGFFPLGPWASRGVAELTPLDHLLGGLLVVHVGTLLALAYLHALGRRLLGPVAAHRAMVLLLPLPGRYYLAV